MGLGAAVVGTAGAGRRDLFDFPGRRGFEWALLLPLAMPAYVVAYAYTDFLQFSGPLHSCAAQFGLEGRVFPEVRSRRHLRLRVSLYPYVYLLVRAFAERAAQLMEAARLLGAPLARRIRAVALPLARPASRLASRWLMERWPTSAASWPAKRIQTFSTGIYKAWLAMDNRIAAQLATCCCWWWACCWRWRRGRRSGCASRPAPRASGGSRCVPCTVPARWPGRSAPAGAAGLRAAARVHAAAAGGGLVRAALGPLPAMVLQQPAAGRHQRRAGRAGRLLLAYRPRAGRARAWCSFSGASYAVPGAVLVVGLLLPVGWLQQAWPQSGVGYWMTAILGIVWAYLVRFVSVALQSVQAACGFPAASTTPAACWAPAARPCSRGCTGRCSSAPPPQRPCWCSST